MESIIESVKTEVSDNINRFISDNRDILVEIADGISRSLINGGKLILFGNGLSSSSVAAMKAVFMIGLRFERPPLPAISLSTSGEIITGFAEKFSFAEIYSKQISALGNETDVAIGFACTENSESVIKGLRAAARNDILTIGFCGKESSMFKGLCDIIFEVHTENPVRVNEIHLVAANLICELVEELMFKSPDM